MTYSEADESKELEQNLNTLPQWAKDLILQLMVRRTELEARVRELEGQSAKNSSNSGKPPSCDGIKKIPETKSQRGNSGRKPDVQNGHLGSTLAQVETLDVIVSHNPANCNGCGYSLQ